LRANFLGTVLRRKGPPFFPGFSSSQRFCSQTLERRAVSARSGGDQRERVDSRFYPLGRLLFEASGQVPPGILQCVLKAEPGRGKGRMYWNIRTSTAGRGTAHKFFWCGGSKKNARGEKAVRTGNHGRAGASPTPPPQPHNKKRPPKTPKKQNFPPPTKTPTKKPPTLPPPPPPTPPPPPPPPPLAGKLSPPFSSHALSFTDTNTCSQVSFFVPVNSFRNVGSC